MKGKRAGFLSIPDKISIEERLSKTMNAAVNFHDDKETEKKPEIFDKNEYNLARNIGKLSRKIKLQWF